MKNLFALALLLAAGSAFAHPGHDHGHGLESIQAGLLHPLTGIDHLLMLLGSGVLAALTGRTLTLPLATLVSLAVGALLGQVLGSLAGMEALILLSLVVAGAALLLQRGRGLLAALLPALALAHGWAHGVEADGTAFGIFAAGFLLVSSLLLAAGFGAGLWLRKLPAVQKVAGSALIASAAVMFAG